jgi:hypothetical protein
MLVGKEEEAEPVERSPGKRAKVSGARDFLKSIGDDRDRPARIDRTRLSVLTRHTRMPEVEHLYDRIERVLPEKSLLIIDSLEGITNRYGLEMEEFVMCLQKDLVENSNTNVVMVLEKTEAGGIEYLVDGLIALSREEVEERRVRHIHLDKLRATSISSPRYLATLVDGRFRALGASARLEHGQAPGEELWQPYPDTAHHFSTGIPVFDTILHGGYVKGSYNAFEIDVNVSIDDYYLLFVPTIINFLALGRGVMGILAGGESPEHLRSAIVPHLPPATFDSRVRIIDYTSTESPNSYVLPMGRVKNRADAQKALQNLEKVVNGGPKKTPYIEYTAFDTLEYQLGDQPTITGLFPSVQRTKILRNVGIGVLKPGLVVSTEIINMMDTYFRIISIDDCPCVYGVRPRTLVYAIGIDQKMGAPHVTLTPIV